MPTYNTAWLRARESGPTTVTKAIMHTPEEQARRKALAAGGLEGGLNIDQILADAKQPSRLQPVNVQDLAETDRRIQQNRAAQQAHLQATGGRENMLQPSLRGLSRAANVLGQTAQAASFPVAFANPALAAGLYAGGEIAQAPENIWQGIERPNEGMGIGEGALRIGGLMLGAQGARAKTPAVRGISDANRPLGPSRFAQDVDTLPIDSPSFQQATKIDWNPGNLTPKIPPPTRMHGYTEEARLRGRAAGLPGTYDDAWTALAELSKRRETPGFHQAPWQSTEDMVLGTGTRPELLSPLDRLSRIQQRGAFARSRPKDIR